MTRKKQNLSTATFSFVHKKGDNAFAVLCVYFDKVIEDSIGCLACVFRLRNARIARNASACVVCVACDASVAVLALRAFKWKPGFTHLLCPDLRREEHYEITGGVRLSVCRVPRPNSGVHNMRPA